MFRWNLPRVSFCEHSMKPVAILRVLPLLWWASVEAHGMLVGPWSPASCISWDFMRFHGKMQWTDKTLQEGPFTPPRPMNASWKNQVSAVGVGNPNNSKIRPSLLQPNACLEKHLYALRSTLLHHQQYLRNNKENDLALSNCSHRPAAGLDGETNAAGSLRLQLYFEYRTRLD